MNSGKAAGKNGLLPELLKCCDDDLIKYVNDLFVVVWEEEEVPRRFACAKERTRLIIEHS